MKESGKAGFSLAEVLVALAILALASGAATLLFFSGTKLDAAGVRLTLAQAEAQTRMEGLVGLTREEFPDDVDVVFDYLGFPALAHVVVTVTGPDGGTLCRLENVLNILPGGGLA